MIEHVKYHDAVNGQNHTHQSIIIMVIKHTFPKRLHVLVPLIHQARCGLGIFTFF